VAKAETNKIWILVALGVVLAGVVVMNLKNFSAPPKAPGMLAAAAATPATIGSARPEPVAAAATEGEPKPPDLWSDLRAMATVPSALTRDGDLRERARQVMDLAPVAREAMAPFAVPQPQAVRPEVAGPAADGVPVEPPTLEFLATGPHGSWAWFAGRPYAQGERLSPGVFRVEAIRSGSVVLSGPGGRTIQWTNTLKHSRPEAP
jgi:hypothetical protein